MTISSNSHSLIFEWSSWSLICLCLSSVICGLSEHEGSLSMHEGSLSVHEGSLSEHEGSLSEHEGSLSEHEGSLSVHEGSRKCLEVWISTRTRRLVELASKHIVWVPSDSNSTISCSFSHPAVFQVPLGSPSM